MLGLTSLSLVYTSLLLLIVNASTRILSLEAQWPYNLPPHMKYFPEDETLVRRTLEIRERLGRQKPVGVRKMNADEGEMFFPEYWLFHGAVAHTPLNVPTDNRLPASHLATEAQDSDLPENWNNATVLYPLQAPLSLHHNPQIDPRPLLPRLGRLPRAILGQLNERDDFQCPGDTLSCTSINRPNSCCPIGESCQLIANAGLGDAGCCAGGQTCSQQVPGCQDGYRSCPGSPGGGCCIPGYECVGVGCKLLHLSWLNLMY